MFNRKRWANLEERLQRLEAHFDRIEHLGKQNETELEALRDHFGLKVDWTVPRMILKRARRQ